MHEAFTIIIDDHRQIETLFTRYKNMDDDNIGKQAILEEICDSLENHATMEEEFLYPAIRKILNDEGVALVDEAYVEHTLVKKLVANLRKQTVNENAFQVRTKLFMLEKAVMHHVKEEEDELIPKVTMAVSEEQLSNTASHMRRFKEKSTSTLHTET
jgi:hemerythrin superfamily protein